MFFYMSVIALDGRSYFPDLNACLVETRQTAVMFLDLRRVPPPGDYSRPPSRVNVSSHM